LPRVNPSLFALAVVIASMSLAALAFARVWLRERRRAREARREALLDPLTGIPNRLSFEQHLSQEWNRARRYRRPLGLLLLDMDGLKTINYGQGHAAGDRALQVVAGLISRDVRNGDVAARLAGDEFVVLCPETDMPALEQLADKLRARLDSDAVGMSVGFAEREPADHFPHEMLKRADAAMDADKARRSAREARAPRALATSKLSASHAS
jgi:diguanylate cyclase (GGDEF)-like protein